MVTLFGPILAQLVTLSLGERTEARVVATDSAYYEAAFRPTVGVSLMQKQLTLRLGYFPSFTITPLDSEPRSLLVFQSGSLAGTYAWRRTTLTVNQSVGYGEVNFRTLAIAGPAPTNATPTNNGAAGGPVNGGTAGGAGGAAGGGTPTGGPAPAVTPTGSQALSSNQIVHYGTSSTSARLAHDVSGRLSLAATAVYSVTGALNATARASYPLVFGPTLTGTAAQRFDHQNAANHSVSLQYALASNGSQTWLTTSTETWSHQFGPRVSTTLGVGLSIGRNSRVDGYVAYSIDPTLLAGISDVNQLYPGTLALSLAAFSAPALDPVTLAVDPRVTVTGAVGLQLGAFSTSVNGSGTFSVSDQKQGAFASAGGGAGIGYRFGEAVSVDGGARVAWQAYQGVTLLPWTYAGFLALTLSASARLR